MKPLLAQSGPDARDLLTPAGPSLLAHVSGAQASLTVLLKWEFQ